MKRILAIFSILVLMLCMSMTALAAVSPLYPAEVKEYPVGEQTRLERVYLLQKGDDPDGIPLADFTREGYSYMLIDLLQTDMTEREEKECTKLVTIPSNTTDMDKILSMLSATLELSTEDGFSGVLFLDHTSIGVEASGYATKSSTVTATRSYPNLSDADLSLIPKTITDSGRSLELTNVDWQSADESGTFFSATATYSGKANTRYATGYTVSASYTGILERVKHDTVMYTAIFSGAKIEPPAPPRNSLFVPFAVMIAVGLTIIVVVGIHRCVKPKRRRGA